MANLCAKRCSAEKFFVAPGIQDYDYRDYNRARFDFVCGSGYWTIASAHGPPDAGIATYSQMSTGCAR
jgi:hypothetical protein